MCRTGRSHRTLLTNYDTYLERWRPNDSSPWIKDGQKTCLRTQDGTGSTKFSPANLSCSDCGSANNTLISAPPVDKLLDMGYLTTTNAPAAGCPRNVLTISVGAPARAERTSSWRMCQNLNNGLPQTTTLNRNCATGWLSTSEDGARYASRNWENYRRNSTWLHSAKMRSAGET